MAEARIEAPHRGAHAGVSVPPLGRAGHGRVLHRRFASNVCSACGRATAACSCRRSSTIPRPASRLDEFVPVGPGGVVTTWAWVETPRAKHPLDRAVRVGADQARRRDERACCTPSTRAAPRRCGRACACGRAGTRRPRGQHPRHRSASSRSDHERREPVTSIKTPDPARLYATPPGAATPRFLLGIAEGRILGQRCPERARRSTCRRAARARCAACRPTDEVEVSDKGTVTTFCIVRIPVRRAVGAAALRVRARAARRRRPAVLRARPGVPARRRCAWACASRRCGRRREELAATFESIRYFRPIDEPDAPFEQLQGAPLMRDVAVVGFAQSPSVRRELDGNEVEILMPVLLEAQAQAGLAGKDDRLHLLRQLRLPGGPAVRVRERARRGRRVAADRRVARRDGRRVGALRGLGEDPDRRGRFGAGLRLREVVDGRSARGADDAARSVLRWRRSGPTRSRSRRCRRARTWRRAARPSAISRRSRRAAGATRRSNPNAQLTGVCRRRRSCSPRRTSCRRCASTTARRSPTAAPRSCSPPATSRKKSECKPGLDPRHRPPHRAARARRARSHALAVDEARRREGRRRQGQDRRRRAARAVHAPGADPARGARARRRRDA